MVSLPQHDWTVVGEALSAISQSEFFIGFGRKMYTDYEIVCRVSIRKIRYYDSRSLSFTYNCMFMLWHVLSCYRRIFLHLNLKNHLSGGAIAILNGSVTFWSESHQGWIFHLYQAKCSPTVFQMKWLRHDAKDSKDFFKCMWHGLSTIWHNLGF